MRSAFLCLGVVSLLGLGACFESGPGNGSGETAETGDGGAGSSPGTGSGSSGSGPSSGQGGRGGGGGDSAASDSGADLGDAGDGNAAGSGGGGAGADAGGNDGGSSGTGGGGPQPAEYEILYASEQLPSFFLTIPDASWQPLSTCSEEDLAGDPPPAECSYQPATFHAEYDPDPLDAMTEIVQSPEQPIGVRLKGRASFRPIDDKPGFKVRFTAGTGERFLGLSRLTLNNMVQDPSALRERMAYRVYRDAGLPAPLANSARVYVHHGDGGDYQYYGLYANVETLDRRFVERVFGEVAGEAGNLFDTKNTHYFTDFDRDANRDQAGTAPNAQEALFDLETNDDVPDTSDLTAAIDAVYVEDIEASATQLITSASPVIDVDQWLRLAAAQAMITDWDGWAGARNNYKAYHDLVRDKFVLLPWGTDQTFGYVPSGYTPNWHYNLQHETSNRVRALFLLRCLADTTDCADRYLRIAGEVAEAFDTQALLDEVDRVALQIESAALEDERRGFDDASFPRSVQYVRHFIEHRRACVDHLLAGEACDQLTCPAGDQIDCHP